MLLNGVMKNNKLIIAAAGSGKTTYLINEAMKFKDEKVLITTYTEANEAEIKSKIFKRYKSIPSHITIQTWFSFLIQHGVKPYQGTFNDLMFYNDVHGLDLVSQRSAGKYDRSGKQIISNGHPLYWAEENFQKHYFNSKWKIYSDKLAKFVFNSNESNQGEIISRISRIFSQIYIDEVQDLAGYDLELIKLLFKSSSKITLVGDPRQVTYLTHNEAKHSQYSDGKIKQFLEEKCSSLIDGNIDETSLSVSHRNNKEICDYSSKLYPELPVISPCKCLECRLNVSNHNGLFLVREIDKEQYLKTYNPVQLRWNTLVKTDTNYSALNFGESKGKTLERVLIYPTEDMKKWILNNNFDLKSETRAKFYVAITRAKYSVGIVYDHSNTTDIEGITNYLEHSQNPGELF
jgi:DNA helicase-2/ATP-dependent DNA helicase PcrA